MHLAEQQDASNHRQVEQGLLAPGGERHADPQTQIATFQQNVFLAQNALRTAENALKYADAGRSQRSDVGHGAQPGADARCARALPSTLEDAVKEALFNRPGSEGTNGPSRLISINWMRVYRASRPSRRSTPTRRSAFQDWPGHPIVASGSNPFSEAFGPLVNQINALSAQAGFRR